MSASATVQKKPTHEPAAKPENGTVAASKPAPSPAPTVSDEELRKSMEEEAQEVEEEETAQKDDAPAAVATPKEEEEEENQVSLRLFGAAKEVTDEIEECDKIIEKAESDYKAKLEVIESEHSAVVEQAEARREELKTQFQTALNKMQSAFGLTPNQTRRAPVARQPQKRSSNGGKSIRLLITEYLEKHRSARTSEIRSFLQSEGRTTNPGVELSRMVKDGSIINKERGMYTLGKPRS